MISPIKEERYMIGVPLYLPPALDKKLSKLAKRRGLRRGEFIRRLLQKGLERDRRERRRMAR